MEKRGKIFLLVCFLLSTLIIGSVFGDSLFSEGFWAGTDWRTDIPGWTKSSTDTSGRDDQWSRTGPSDGNYYAWIMEDTVDQYIERTGISTSGYRNIEISYYYNLHNIDYDGDYIKVEWKPSSSGTWNLIEKSSSSGWSSKIIRNLPGAENLAGIDTRISEDSLEAGEYLFIDDINITGDAILGSCGDNNVDIGEECDDGVFGSPQCTVFCTKTFCGDGVKQQPNGLGKAGPQNDGIEACDDGNLIDNDSCNNNCELPQPVCGNGAIEEGEQCDDGNLVPGDGCDEDCQFEIEPYCGDGIINRIEEECELPNTLNSNNCTQTQNQCELGGNKKGARDAYGNCDSSCICLEDSFVYSCSEGECGAECDSDDDCEDENPDTTDRCNLGGCLCVYTPIAECGNNIHEPGEECDDGNEININDSCRNNCTLPYCWDGIRDSGEQCDDGNFDNFDSCVGFCKIAYCLDRYINVSAEECDDGNNLSNDGCDEGCKAERQLCTAPLDVMLVMDISGSMGVGGRLDSAKNASKNFTGLLDDTKDQIGLVSFKDTASLVLNLTLDHTGINDSIDALSTGGKTNIGDGILKAQKEIETHGRYNASHIIILLSDGAPNEPNASCLNNPTSPTKCTQYALDQANAANASGTRIYTIGLAVNNFTADLLRNMSLNKSNYHPSPTPKELEEIYKNLSSIICPCGDRINESKLGEQCDDGNNYNYDNCTNECKIPFCGDGYVHYLDSERCESPNSTNNFYCTQKNFSCDGPKKGTRDVYGNCSASCTCLETPFNYACSKGDCGAQCDKGGGCEPYCDGNIRHYNGSCDLSSCSCSWLSEDCDSYDSWNDTNNTRWVNNTECSEKEQKERKYENYSCSPQGCQAENTSQWLDTGNTRNKLDGTPCDDELYCNGQETCVDGSCQDGTPVDCDDRVNCTDGICDEDNDTCVNTENNTNCPPDTICADYYCHATLDCQANYEPNTTECRVSTGVCDIAEFCTGTGPDCPADAKSTAQCRQAAGDCDIAEVCDGINNDCPTNVFKPLSTDCGICAHCDGLGSCVYDETQDSDCSITQCPDSCTIDNNPYTWDYAEDVPNECAAKGNCSKKECGYNHECRDNDSNDGINGNTCGAQCDQDADCDDNYTCSKDCLCLCCGDCIKDPGEDCDDCNLNRYDSCSDYCKWTFCGDSYLQRPNGKGIGGPLNNGYEDCDDGNQNNNDGCLGNCINASCGDAHVWVGIEGCEYPNTTNNIYCSQLAPTDCKGRKQGTRDSYGNCNASCQCLKDNFTNYQCVKGECGAQCAVDADCEDGNNETEATCNLEKCLCEYELIRKDSKVALANPATNFGKGKYMMVNPKIAGIDRSYIGINASHLLGQNISNATLRIAVYYTGSSVVGTSTEAYYCPDHDFVETNITWNNQPIDDDCILADTYAITNKVVAGIPETWHEFDLLAETIDELNDDGLFTVVLKSAEEGSVSDNSKYVQYLTKDYSEVDYRPKFEIS